MRRSIKSILRTLVISGPALAGLAASPETDKQREARPDRSANLAS
jgi:hypothetical protein